MEHNSVTRSARDQTEQKGEKMCLLVGIQPITAFSFGFISYKEFDASALNLHKRLSDF